jgi:antitoxin MazE
MQATIQKWGNSLALRVPKEIARQTGLTKGSNVRLTVKNDQLIVSPVIRDAISLKSLASKITPENIHSETDWGPSQGKEIW